MADEGYRSLETKVIAGDSSLLLPAIAAGRLEGMNMYPLLPFVVRNKLQPDLRKYLIENQLVGLHFYEERGRWIVNHSNSIPLAKTDPVEIASLELLFFNLDFFGRKPQSIGLGEPGMVCRVRDACAHIGYRRRGRAQKYLFLPEDAVNVERKWTDREEAILQDSEYAHQLLGVAKQISSRETYSEFLYGRVEFPRERDETHSGLGIHRWKPSGIFDGRCLAPLHIGG